MDGRGPLAAPRIGVAREDPGSTTPSLRSSPINACKEIRAACAAPSSRWSARSSFSACNAGILSSIVEAATSRYKVVCRDCPILWARSTLAERWSSVLLRKPGGSLRGGPTLHLRNLSWWSSPCSVPCASAAGREPGAALASHRPALPAQGRPGLTTGIMILEGQETLRERSQSLIWMPFGPKRSGPTARCTPSQG